MREHKVFDIKPAGNWLESVPVGNGRMGATLMCGVSEEVIHLNEETIWSSIPGGEPNPKMPEKLKTIRDLFLAGKPAEADKLAKTLLSDCFTRIRSYESAGLLKIALHENDHSRNYRHELDIMRGIAKIEYDKDGTHYTRECFASHPDDLIVYRVTSDNAPLNASVALDRENIISNIAKDGEITVIAKTVFGDHKFCVKIRVDTDGTVTERKGELVISDTQSFVLYINIATEFNHGANFEKKASIAPHCFTSTYNRHVDDFLKIMSRADIALPEAPEMDAVSMDARIKTFGYNKPNDGELVTLLWQFGRYMLISSGREDTLPANLQGVWTDGNVSPWSSDYHTNINLQMNYWPAEVANLSDIHMSLFNYMNKYLFESGKKTAQIGYNTRGCVVHHLSDIYGFTAPADGLWGIWPHGASWLCFNLWDHYLYTKDLDYLKNTAYNFIHECSLFFLDNMVEDSQGRLLYGPSTSPENSYYVPDENGEKYSCFLAISSTMDVAIIGGLLKMYLEASKLLGISDKDTEYAAVALKKLPPFKVGKLGIIQEWIEDYEEVEPGHRHISPTFGLYPDSSINRSTPELYEAVGKTLDRRLAGGVDQHGQGATTVGWSLAWLICEFARLRRAEDAYNMIFSFLTSCTSSNLMDIYPAKTPCFQIDGNMGYVAGVCEMLIQSHEETIALIPALPQKWDHGSFRGLCARGGFEVDCRWKDFEVLNISLKASCDNDAILELPSTQKTLTFVDDAGAVYNAVDGKIKISLKKDLVVNLIAQ